MRKLPRRLPSNSPSAAWAAFAALALVILLGIGGLYAHRQNQETNRRRQIAELSREIDDLREKNAQFDRELAGRLLAPALQVAVNDARLPLIHIGKSAVRPAPGAAAGTGAISATPAGPGLALTP